MGQLPFELLKKLEKYVFDYVVQNNMKMKK